MKFESEIGIGEICGYNEDKKATTIMKTNFPLNDEIFSYVKFSAKGGLFGEYTNIKRGYIYPAGYTPARGKVFKRLYALELNA